MSRRPFGNKATGWEPALNEGEQVLAQQQGAYLAGRAWRFGRLYLTNDRLLFCQPRKLTLEVPLSHVTKLAHSQRAFVLATKTCLDLSYQKEDGGRTQEATVITADLEAWTQRLAEVLTGLGVDFEGPEEPADDDDAQGETSDDRDIDAIRQIALEDLEQVAVNLDPASAELIWYLWEHGHARIEELRQVVGAPSHMHVLTRIRETINPAARRLLGQQLLVFEPRRVDAWTGEVVPFSWWLCKGAERRPAREENRVDIFDEGDHIEVIMELDGVEEEDIQVESKRKRLLVIVGGRLWQEVALPDAVNGRAISSRYHNNVLQVQVKKRS